MKQFIYLDNAASTSVLPIVAEKILFMMQVSYGNPSSGHMFGLEAKNEISKAKKIIGDIVNVPAQDVYFTSGATESNNMAILGGFTSRKKYRRHLILTRIEHPSVLEAAKAVERDGYEVTWLDVNKHGHISPNDLGNALRPDTALVSIMHVNNEFGSVQNLEEIGRLIKSYNRDIYFHSDCVQSFCKLKLDAAACNLDILSISGHKIHAAKGIGAIYVKNNIKLPPYLLGGGQQNNFRSGTENTSGIVGLSEAANYANANMEQNYLYVKDLKFRIIYGIKTNINGYEFNGDIENGSPYIINVSFFGINGETLMHLLEEKGIYVSTSSACNSKKKTSQSVLDAIGADAKGAIRISLSALNTVEEINIFLKCLYESVAKLRKAGK